MSKDMFAKYWKKIALVAITAIISIASYLYVDTRECITRAEAGIDTLREKKADKEDINRIEGKIDRLTDVIIRGHK